jgi:hypothetical protein
MVRSYSAVGIPQADIAKVLGIDEKTLAKYYRFELDTAATQAVGSVGGALYTKAMNGDVTAQIFFLKCRGRWVAAQPPPIPVTNVIVTGVMEAPVMTEADWEARSAESQKELKESVRD